MKSENFSKNKKLSKELKDPIRYVIYHWYERKNIGKIFTCGWPLDRHIFCCDGRYGCSETVLYVRCCNVCKLFELTVRSKISPQYFSDSVS